MAINWLWNKRNGPGGGTRRLHHVRGRTRIDARSKDDSFARLYHRYRSFVISATKKNTRRTARNSNLVGVRVRRRVALLAAA